MTICAPANHWPQACPNCGYSVAPASTDDELKLIAAEPVVAMQPYSSPAVSQLAHTGEDSITVRESQQTETTPDTLLAHKQS